MKYFFFLLLITTVASCTKDKALEADVDDCEALISYNDQIKPLIQHSCATNLGAGTGCHDAWIFEYENLNAPISSGTFWSVIETRYMPIVPNNFGIEELTVDEMKLFKCWIKQGALNN